MRDKLECPQESSIKWEDRCQRRNLGQNTTKRDTAEASWWLGSLGPIPRDWIDPSLSASLSFMLWQSPPQKKSHHQTNLKCNTRSSFNTNKLLLMRPCRVNPRELAASRAFVFVLWPRFGGHTCWTWFFFSLLAMVRCSERLGSVRAGRTITCFLSLCHEEIHEILTKIQED